jgi:CRISPR-associated protein Csx14
MATAAIPVDLFNPGQVFACLGFLEAADVLLGDAEGGFDWSDETSTTFELRADSDRNPFEAVLEFLASATVFSLAPCGSELKTDKWGIPTTTLNRATPFPFPEPRSPATLPALLKDRNGSALILDYWGDDPKQTNRDNVKFWAGSGGYPGAALASDALNLVRGQMGGHHDNPFSLSSPQSSSFRLDWRRDYIPIDIGFSPNDHSNITMRGYPLVEILAAIGLTNARPQRVDRLTYRYGVIGVAVDQELFSPALLRAALGTPKLPFPQRRFLMALGWPGQENQARCIIDVTEETNS